MPSTLQEWIALGLVAVTIGYSLGRWWAKRQHQRHQGQTSDCSGCPQNKPAPSRFKNIPITKADPPKN